MHSTDYNKTEPVKKVTSICYCWVMGNQTFFTKSKILEKAGQTQPTDLFLDKKNCKIGYYFKQHFMLWMRVIYK